MAACVAALGCPSETTKESDSKEDTQPDKEKKKKKAAPSASVAAKPKRHDLTPLPVSIELPPGAKIVEANDKSAMIEIDKVRMSISTDAFAKKKNTVKTFPFETFQKWVRDDKDAATAQMGPDSFRALKELEVGGKKYVCSNVGTKGLPSAEEAEKMVAHCDTLQAKE